MVSIANNSTITLPMSYEDSSSILSLGPSRGRWKDLRPLEKILFVIIGIVSIISLALIIAISCVGAKLSRVEQSVLTSHSKLGVNGSSTIDPSYLKTVETHPYTTPTTSSTHGPGKIVPSPSCANPPPHRVCIDAECTLAAGDMLRSMDLSVDPCKNFYKFACGNWGETNPMPDSVSRWDQFASVEERIVRQLHRILEDEPDEEADPEPIKMAQKFYDDCRFQKNENNYTSLRTFLDHLLDGFDKNVGKSLGHVRRVLGGNFLFALYVGVDERNPFKHTIYLDQPTFGIPLTLLISNPPHSEVEVYEISTGGVNRTDKAEMYNPYTVEHLHSITRSPAIPISWDSYFDEVFFDIYHPDDDYSKWNHSTVIVRDLHYFNNIAVVLSMNHSAIMLRDFITWRIILTLANDVSHELREMIFELDEISDGLLAAEPLWRNCVRQTNDYFGMALSYHYVQEFFDEENQLDVRVMIDDIKKVLRAALNSDREFTWMSKQTKQRSIAKLDKLGEFVGHPDWLVYGHTSNHTLLTNNLMDYYAHLFLDKDNDHFDNVVEILEWKSRESLKELKKPRDRKKWVLDPTTVAAHYIPTLNSIIVPAGILQSPFYSFYERPLKYLNYGAIGSLMAHMITHVVDHRGSQHGVDGILNSWYDPETQKNYLERASCFTGHFLTYIAQNLTIPIHWKMSLSEESIADNIGLKLAYRAYQERKKREGEDMQLPGFNETSNQLFFVSYAQLWCSDYRLADLKADIKSGSYTPNQFRARGGIESSGDFQRVWSCPAHPERACNAM